MSALAREVLPRQQHLLRGVLVPHRHIVDAALFTSILPIRSPSLPSPALTGVCAFSREPVRVLGTPYAV